MQIYRLISPVWISKNMIRFFFLQGSSRNLNLFIPKGRLPFRDFPFLPSIQYLCQSWQRHYCPAPAFSVLPVHAPFSECKPMQEKKRVVFIHFRIKTLVQKNYHQAVGVLLSDFTTFHDCSEQISVFYCFIFKAKIGLYGIGKCQTVIVC